MNHVMAFCGSMSFIAAFIAGTAGSVHCLAMCGGLSGALGLRARRIGASAGRTLAHALTYQAGRLASYTVAGALVGTIGGTLRIWIDVDHLAVITRALTGFVLIAAAIGMLYKWRPLALLERFGGRFWSRLAPFARRIPTGSLGGSLGLGMLWGFLPCGMVYSMLLVASLAGNAPRGAATMLSFGLGTVPAVLAAGLAGAKGLGFSAGRRFHLVAGYLLLIFGMISVIAPLSLSLRRVS